jgi:hypothetical protein
LPIDLPLVHRLTTYGVSLDSTTSLTHGIHSVEGAFWSAVPLADLGTPTYVLRTGDNGYIAQFRHRLGEQHAHIVFIAPDIDKYGTRVGESAWLSLIDAMTSGAGRRGAFTLNAEVDENSAAFVLLRQCGFAVYARQTIWRREPAPIPDFVPNLLRPEVEADGLAIDALYTGIVPRLVLQADTPPESGRGLIHEQIDGDVSAYFAIQDGRCGIFVQPYLHPEMFDKAAAITGALLGNLPRADRLPVYVCVRRYQDWLGTTLSGLGFEPFASQAVLVKHTVNRIEHPVLATAAAIDGAVRVGPPGRTKIRNCTVEESRNLYGTTHYRRPRKTQGRPPRLSRRFVGGDRA